VSLPIPLTNAVTSGDESAVSALLADGADVNERTSGGQTPLILAIVFGHKNLVQVLVKAGADPEARDNLGLNAVDWAKRRGLTEVLEVLRNSPESNTPARPDTVKPEPREPFAETPPATTAGPEKKETASADEKSRRWLAGLKQRLDEQELKRHNRNETIPEPPQIEEEPPTLMTVSSNETPVTVTINIPEPVQPEVAKDDLPSTVPAIEPPANTSITTGNRKKCPQCNEIYNGDLVSYCAHHIVALVDVDEPIVSEPPKKDPPLFWILVIVTLIGSIAVGLLITTYLYKSNMAAARNAAQHPTSLKGSPEVGGNLVGKAVSLPEAKCPVNGPEPVTGTVIVLVLVDKNGQVYRARGSGGDWLMRGAATDAAMKSTFSPEKLRGREAEGTITYTFKP